MSKTRKWFLAIFLGLAGLVGLGVVLEMNAPVGQGEVSVILHGGFIMLGRWLVVYFLFLALIVYLWHKKWLRIFMLLVAISPIAMAGVELGKSAWRELRDDWQLSRNAAHARVISQKYIDQFSSLGSDTSAFVTLNNKFFAEMDAEQLNQSHNIYSEENHDNYFVWALMTYILIFVDRTYHWHEAYYPTPQNCKAFEAQFAEQLSVNNKHGLLRQACRDYLTEE